MKTFAITPRPKIQPDRSNILAFRASDAAAISAAFPSLADATREAEPAALHGLTKLWMQNGVEVWGVL
jgi:hypothetical protein